MISDGRLYESFRVVTKYTNQTAKTGTRGYWNMKKRLILYNWHHIQKWYWHAKMNRPCWVLKSPRKISDFINSLWVYRKIYVSYILLGTSKAFEVLISSIFFKENELTVRNICIFMSIFHGNRLSYFCSFSFSWKSSMIIFLWYRP